MESSLDVPVRSSPLDPVAQVREVFDALPEFVRLPIELVAFGGELPRADIPRMRWLAQCLRAEAEALNDPSEELKEILAQQDSLGIFAERAAEALRMSQESATKLREQARILADQTAAAANDAERWLCVMFAFGIYLGWQIFRIVATAMAAGPAGQVAAAPAVEATLVKGRAEVEVMRAGLRQAIVQGGANAAGRMSALGALRIPTMLARGAALPVAIDAGVQGLQILNGDRAMAIIGEEGTKNPTGIDLTSLGVAALAGAGGTAGAMAVARYTSGFASAGLGGRLMLGLTHGVAGGVAGLGAASLVVGWPPDYMHAVGPLMNGGFTGAVHGFGAARMAAGARTDGGAAFTRPDLPFRPPVEVSAQAKQAWETARAAWSADPAATPGESAAKPTAGAPTAKPTAEARGNTAAAGETPRPANPGAVQTPETPGNGRASAAPRSEPAPPGSAARAPEAPARPAGSPERLVVAGAETSPPPKVTAPAGGRAAGDPHGAPATAEPQRPVSEGHRAAGDPHGVPAAAEPQRPVAETHRTGADHDAPAARPRPDQNSDPAPDMPAAGRDHSPAEDGAHPRPAAEHDASAGETAARAPADDPARPAELSGRDQADDVLRDFNARSGDRVPEELRLSNLSDEALRAGLFHPSERESLIAGMEIIRRGTISDEVSGGMVLRPQQLEGVFEMGRRPVEVKPGQGKTLMFMSYSLHQAVRHGSTLLVTTADGLAHREFTGYQRVLGKFGIDVFRADQQAGFGPITEGRPAIVVGTSETVGHLVNAGHLPPRRVVLDEMDAIVDRGDRTFIRSEGPQRAASEEVAAEVLDGHDFLTDALAKGQLSHEDFGLKRIAEEVDVDLPDGTVEIGTEYWYDGQAKLTPAGLEKVEALPGGTRWLRDMGLSRLEMAAAAEFTVRDKTHYVMDEGKIVIIDQGEHGLQRNPTTSSESRWSAEPGKASLAQAIEAKELRIAEVRGRSAAEHQIMVRADTDSAKSITAPEIYGGDRYFDHVTGASGTLTDLGGVLKSVYGLETPHGIEPAKPSQLREGQLDVHENTRAKLNAIADYAHRMWDGGTGRAQEILVHRNDLVDQQVRALVRAGVPREAIEAVDAHRMAKWGAGWEAEMQKIFDSAGREGKILVINRQGQRGVDIPVSPEVEAKGGLHIWMTEAPEQSYIYDQAKNRTARNGNSGTAQALMSPQDEIIRKAMHLQGVREAVVRYEQAGAEHTTDPTPQTRERLIEAGEHLGSLVPGLQERAHHHATTDFILRHALTDQSGTLTAADLVDVMTPWHPDTADIGRPDLPEDRADRLADMLGIPQPAMAAALADPALTGRDGADPLRQLLEQAGLPPAAVDALRHQVDATAPATAVRHALFTDEQALNELTPQLAAFAGRLGWELADITGAEGLRRIGGELTGARYDLAAALGVPVADITPAMARDILGEQVMRQLSDTGDQVSASKADTDTRVDASIQTDTDTAGTPVAGTQPGDILVTEDVIASTSHYLALAALLDLAVAIHRRTPNNCVNNGVTAMRILCPDNAQRFTMPSGGVPLAGHGWDTVTRAFRDGSPVRSATLEQAVESVKQRPGGIQVLVYKWKDTEEQGSSDADNHLVVLVNDSAPGDPPNLVVVDLAANRDGDPAADFGPMDLTNRRTLLNKAVAFDTWQREQRKFIDRLPAGMRAFWTMDFDHAGNAVPGTTHPGAPATETLPRRVDVDPELVRDVEEALVAPQKAGSQVPDRPPENTIDLSPPGAARPVGPIGSKPGEFHLPGVMPADADEVTSSTVDRNDLLVDDGLLIHRLPSSELFPAPDVVNIELVDRNDMLIDDDLIVYRVTYARDEDAIIEWVKAEIGWRMGAPIHRSSLEPAGIAPERRHNAVYREQHDKYDNSRYHSLGAPADDILAVFGAVTGHREGLASAFVHETNEGAIWVDHHLSEEYINALAEKVEKVAETIESCRDLLTPESFALARDFHAQALSAFGEIARRAGNPERVRAIADEVEAKKEVIRKFREKHGIEEVVGFDSPYVPLENVEEIFETLDMLLVKYKIAPDSGKPMTDITSIRTDLRPHSSKMGTGSRDIDGKSFMLYDLHFASNVVSSLYGDRLDAVVGFHPVSGLRPHADTIIHEFAHAIDFATDSELSDNLPEVLRNVHADLRDRGLVDSYEQWLRRMPVYAFTDKKKTELNPGEALAVGFAVVEIVENTGGSVAVDDPAWAIHQYVTKLRAPVLDPGLRVDQRLSEGEPSKVEPMDSPAGVQIELLTYEDGRQVLRETYDFIQDAVVEWVKADIGRRMGAPIAEAVLVANATDSNADYRVIHREYEPISSRYRNFGAGADDILAVFGAVTGDRVGLSTAFVHENIRGETVWVDHHLGKEYISELGKRVEDIEKIFDDFRSAIPPEILADSPGFLAVVSDAHEQVMTAFGELARHAGKQDPVEVVEAQNAAKASVIGAFTDKYSIEVAGFDSPYIPLETVEEIFETFDMLLEKYRTSPVGSLAPVGISGIRSDLLRPTGRAVTFPVVDAKGGPASEIIFNLHFTSDLISSLRGDKLVAEAGYQPVNGLRPYADVVIHEFVHAADNATGRQLREALPTVLHRTYEMLRNHGLTESYGEWLARLPGYAFIDWEKTELNPLEALAVGFSVAEIAENTGGGIAVGHPAWVIHQYVTTWRMPVVDPGLRVDQRLVDSWSADPAFGVPEVVAVDGGDAGGLLVDHGVVIGDAAVEAVTGAGRPDRSDVVWVSVPLKVFEGLVGREGWLKVAGEVAPRFDRLVESANSQDFPAGPPVLVRGRVRVSVGWYHGVRLGDSDGVVAHEDLAGRSWRPEGGGMRVAGLPDVYAWTQERGLLEPEESGWIKEYLLDPGRGPLPEPVFARERAEVVEILGSRLPADALEDPEIQRGIRLAAEGLFINRVLYGDPEVGRVNHLYDDAFEMPGFGVTAFYHNGMSAAVDLAHIVDNGVRQDAEVGEIVLAMVAEAWSDLVYGGGRRSDNEEGYDELRSAELLEVRALSAGYSRGTAGVLAFAVNGTGFDETNGTQMVSSPTAFEEMRGRWAISDADLPAARRIAGWVAAGDLQTLSEPDALVSSIELALEDLMSRRYGPADRVLGRALSELGSRANTVDAALRFADSYQWLRPRGTGATVRRMLIDRLRGNARFIHPDTGYRPPPGWRLGNPAMRVDHAAKLREIVGRLETDSAYQPSDAYRDALAHTAAMREKYDSPDRTGGHIGSRPAADTGPTGSVGGRHWDSAGNRRTPWSLRSRSSAVGPGRSDRPETPGAAAAAVPVSPSAGAPTTLAHLDARWDSAGNRRTPWSLRSRSSAVGPGRSDRPETPGAAAAAVPVSPSAGAPTTLAHLDARAEEGNYDDRVATPVTTRHEAQFETLDVHPGGHEPPAPAVERLILVNRTAAFDPKVDTSSLGVTRALKDPDSNFGGRIGSRPSADSGPTGSVGQTVNFRHPESGHVDVVFTPPGGAEISLRLVPGKEYVLGRSAVLSGVATNHVSRRHATIRVDDAGHVFLRDDDSKNGTFIDGKQMVAGKWVRVHDGQQLELGRNFELGIDFRRQVAEIRLFGNDAPPLRLHRGSSVVIGRKLLSPARVDRPTMSREHAKVGMDENGRIWLQDIGSMNGTRVNGVRLAEGEQRMLRPGDTVRFGSADGEAQFSPADATGIVAPVQVRLDSGPVPSDREPIPESPFGSMPPFQTTEMLEKFRGEHLPGNSVWEGTHVVYHNSVSRSALRLTIRGGLLYDSAGNLFDTSSGYSAWGGEGRAIFVMDHDGNFYASNYHSMGLFHHSSFLAGGPVAAAGELVVTKGRLQLLTDKSGHYEPARSYTLQAINYLRSLGVEIDMTQVQFDAPQ